MHVTTFLSDRAVPASPNAHDLKPVSRVGSYPFQTNNINTRRRVRHPAGCALHHSELWRQHRGLRSGYRLIPVDLSYTVQCLIFNCSVDPHKSSLTLRVCACMCTHMLSSSPPAVHILAAQTCWPRSMLSRVPLHFHSWASCWRLDYENHFLLLRHWLFFFNYYYGCFILSSEM